jgi:hypothetical protein
MSKEKYDYSKDITDDHKHRPKIFEMKDEWEQDKISIIFACKDCHKLGLADDVSILYDEEEVQWQE